MTDTQPSPKVVPEHVSTTEGESSGEWMTAGKRKSTPKRVTSSNGGNATAMNKSTAEYVAPRKSGFGSTRKALPMPPGAVGHRFNDQLSSGPAGSNYIAPTSSESWDADVVTSSSQDAFGFEVAPLLDTFNAPGAAPVATDLSKAAPKPVKQVMAAPPKYSAATHLFPEAYRQGPASTSH